MIGERGFRTPETAYYFQPETFTSDKLVAKNEPSGGSGRTITWRVPDDLIDVGFVQEAFRDLKSQDSN